MLQPPTDNLYKFVAIFGLLILGFVMVYPWTRIYELAKDEARLRGELNVLELEAEQLKTSNDPSAPAQSKLKQLQLRNKYDVQTIAIEQTRDLVHLMIAGSIVGFAMVIFGFVAWYRKVQRYQDLILVNEAKSSAETEVPSDVASVTSPERSTSPPLNSDAP